MQSKSIGGYIWFGLHYRYLQDAAENRPIHGNNYILNNINVVLEYIDELNLIVTKRAANNLVVLKEKLEKEPIDARLSVAQAGELSKTMAELQRTLEAESNGIFAYIVTEKRIETKRLLQNVASLFNPQVYEEIPENIKYDFDEAGKCIAFERSTAAAFHILRGTEGILRWFYCAFTKQKRVKPLLWGNMTEHLKKRKSIPPAEIINNLDHIRLSFRNPTQHPDKIYDIQEAQDLFFVCVDTINRMVKFKVDKKGSDRDLKIKVIN